MPTPAWRIVAGVIAAVTPALATSTGEPIRRTGAAVDGGLTCNQCHNQFAPPVNQGSGRILVSVNAYTPGVKQSFNVQITDSSALRWGFQITARFASDETRQAGSFTASDTVRVQCDPVGEAPCNGALEFASHRAASTGGGVRGQRTYVVEWTPPGRDQGAVIFYAAGLAADGEGIGSGSRTYTTSSRIGPAACTFTLKPGIDTRGVTNGATFQPGIAPNSLITIFGASFAYGGDKYKAVKNDLVAGKLPPDLACAAVEIGGQRAPIFYTQLDQINAQAPNLAPGPATAVVILNPGAPNELRSDPAAVQIQPVSPGFFTYAGSNGIAGLNASNGNRILADPGVVPGGVFARPGDIVTLYGTGFGPTSPPYQSGEFSTGPAPLQQSIAVTMGGTTLGGEDVLYAGLSPDAPGFYQFNLRVPPSAPDGNLPVSIRIAGAITQAGATIPVKR